MFLIGHVITIPSYDTGVNRNLEAWLLLSTYCGCLALPKEKLSILNQLRRQDCISLSAFTFLRCLYITVRLFEHVLLLSLNTPSPHFSLLETAPSSPPLRFPLHCSFLEPLPLTSFTRRLSLPPQSGSSPQYDSVPQLRPIPTPLCRPLRPCVCGKIASFECGRCFSVSYCSHECLEKEKTRHYQICDGTKLQEKLHRAADVLQNLY